jgi:alkanesulfonate monooxygenase SsuD/methylene tetrahydromethanopterin reductase-like flavin-dependent oxidoreductase (luciferase family)
VRFGLLGSPEASGFRDYIELCVEAEALGYHSSFLVEHHFSGWDQISAPLTLQASVAMRTTTLRLGTAVIVLPWHNPVLLAEQAATIDVVSEGRLDLGVGKGYRHNEFGGFAIPPEEAAARFEESLSVLTQCWSSRTRFSHHGRFWNFDEIVVEPAPWQTPHPPVWLAAKSPDSIRGAARRGFNLILDQYASPADVAAGITLYRSECVDFDPTHVAVARQVYVARDAADRDAALARLAAYTQRTVEVSRAPRGDIRGSHVLSYAATPGATEAHALFGTPDEIGEALAELRALGVEYVLAFLLGGREQLRRFAEDVIAA